MWGEGHAAETNPPVMSQRGSAWLPAVFSDKLPAGLAGHGHGQQLVARLPVLVEVKRAVVLVLQCQQTDQACTLVQVKVTATAGVLVEQCQQADKGERRRSIGDQRKQMMAMMRLVV